MLSRGSGILLPISSLPSKYGIGTFGKEAYKFVDFLCAAGQKYWQLLPMGPVSYGDSPYSSFSVFAGNPYYIDLEFLVEEGLIAASDCELLEEADFVDYENQFNNRYKVLYKAYEGAEKYKEEINELKLNYSWVLDYSLFMALKYQNNQLPWYKWDVDIANRNDESLKMYKILLEDKINFWTFLQLLFYKQYFKLKAYANEKGIKIIGDMPIYAAEDSADVWANRKLFAVDENNMPSLVAGVPPDAFSSTGQLWGNPVYNWGYLEKNSYQLWIDRIKWSMKLFDIVRIDHFRGFDEYWAIPYGSKNAIEGKWLPAKGRELFETAAKEVDLNIIAEDLGIITESVTKLKDSLGFPGMKVLQFAFDGNIYNPHLPVNYEENSVAYTGTHDNDTLKGWFEKLNTETKRYVLEFLKIDSLNETEIIDELVNSVLQSKANLAIIPLQDYLYLDSKARINTPSTVGRNWMWRIKKEMLTENLAYKIKAMTQESNR